MSGAGYILGINLFVAGLLASAFVMIAVYDRTHVAARWLAGGYALGMGYYAAEFIIPLLGGERVGVVAAFAIFLAATVAFNVGVARRYNVPAPWRMMAAIFVVSTLAVFVMQDLPRQSFTRMMAYQTPYFLMQAIAAAMVFSVASRRLIDTLFAGLLTASALQFLSKPFLAYAFGGWGGSAQTYLQSNYALVSQSMGTVFAMAIALMMLVILVQELLSDMTAKSETDTLSGLLNRRGFEARARIALRDVARKSMPLSLVICDLDDFKQVNDTFGHARGDRVIVSFADLLRQAMAGQYAAGRIGGEEFAILLPGTNLTAARLFAEGARNAFSALEIEGLPSDRRITASFGVAELAFGEDIPDLLKRADEALYEAKNSGRDCVRTSPNPLQAFGPLSRAG